MTWHRPGRKGATGMLPPVDSNFEQRLVTALQPIRHFVLAQVLHHFMNSGLYDLLDRSSQSAAAISERLHMDRDRVDGVLSYLVNEGYVRREGEKFALTSKARDMKPFQPWYQLLVGGYAETFQQIGRVLGSGVGYATRSGADVGAGSCGMSRYDALPLMLRLLEPIRDGIRHVIDLGCGTGLALADLIEQLPGVSATGVDPEPASVQAGTKLMAERGLADRVQIQVASAQDAPSLPVPGTGACYSTAFVLQELLEQQGRAHVVRLIAEVFKRNPRAHWIVIEVDNQMNNRKIMAHELATAYYNPYFLIHRLTEQRLENEGFWQELFREAGADIVLRLTTDPSVDSTGLELGYLLCAAEPGDQP